MLHLKTKSFLAILLCAALLSGPVTQSQAQDSQTATAPAQGSADADAPKTTKVRIPDVLIKKWQAQAEAGNADAQFLLGNAYYNGNGVPQDYNEALSWWQKAADQGNVSAKKSLEQLVPK
jgi:TPR repeat protein